MTPPSPTATNVPLPYATFMSMASGNSSGTRTVQFVPVVEVRIAPCSPTITNVSLAKVTAPQWKGGPPFDQAVQCIPSLVVYGTAGVEFIQSSATNTPLPKATEAKCK